MRLIQNQDWDRRFKEIRANRSRYIKQKSVKFRFIWIYSVGFRINGDIANLENKSRNQIDKQMIQSKGVVCSQDVAIWPHLVARSGGAFAPLICSSSPLSISPINITFLRGAKGDDQAKKDNQTSFHSSLVQIFIFILM